MSMAPTLEKYMETHRCTFELVPHEHSYTSIQSARLARVPGECMAKPVMLEDDRGYLMAVLPASRHIDLELMHRYTGRHLRLAREYEFAPMFGDCELGAVPPVGPAYGLETMIDESLCREREIWFEAGDHERLVHMGGDQFLAMMGSARRAQISRMAH